MTSAIANPTRTHTAQSPARSPVVELAEATVAFPSPEGPRIVLHSINFSIMPGEFVAIVGPNGSGKSTFGRVLADLCPLSRGHRGQQPRPGLFTQMVFQNPDSQLVAGTVFEEVCFGLGNLMVPPVEMRQRALEALETVGLRNRCDDKVEILSGGQKQLLCIAASLAMKPRLLIFDEATAMLDPEARQVIQTTATRLHKKGQTIVWITHRMAEAALADRVVGLHAGQLTFDGPPDEFFYGSDATAGATTDAPAATSSPCTQLGFQEPYAVQVAKHLASLGHVVPGKPLTLQDLAAALCSDVESAETTL